MFLILRHNIFKHFWPLFAISLINTLTFIISFCLPSFLCFSPCFSFIGSDGSTSTPSFICDQTPSPNSHPESLLFINTTDCAVSLTLSPAVLLFPTEDSVAELDINIPTDTVFAYALRLLVEVDTGIGKDETTRISRGEMVYVPTDDLALRGMEASTFTVHLVGSSFIDTTSRTSVGMHVESISHDSHEQTVDAANFYTKFGFHVKVNLIQDQHVIHTEWSRKQEWSALIADVLATISNFIGIFGMAVLILEIFASLSLPCGITFHTDALHSIYDLEERDAGKQNTFVSPQSVRQEPADTPSNQEKETQEEDNYDDEEQQQQEEHTAEPACSTSPTPPPQSSISDESNDMIDIAPS